MCMYACCSLGNYNYSVVLLERFIHRAFDGKYPIRF